MRSEERFWRALYEKGQCIGLMGRSGAGKSTLADVILGFLEPESGVVLVNGQDVRSNLRAWMSRAAYIPQAPLLLDDSLRRNVALGDAHGVEAERRLWLALEAAQLADLARSLPQGLIPDRDRGPGSPRTAAARRAARALYFDREFIVLDEATSALDEETETRSCARFLGPG
jgi:ABC-type multidrug transport system fused ATPase/permease subunit